MDARDEEEEKRGGYIHLWRCLKTSQVWMEMPYSTGKLWLWLLMEAKYEGQKGRESLMPGQLNHSISFMREALAWIDVEQHRMKRPSPPTLYKGLNALEAIDSIKREVLPGRGGGITLITICNWSIYQSQIKEGNNDHNNARNNARNNELENSPISTSVVNRTTDAVEALPEAQKNSRTKAPYASTPEAEKALTTWKEKAALPATCNEQACLKKLDQLHSIDKLSWDRIERIIVHAATKWVPAGYIASPMKLREDTRAKDMKTWEAIERQIIGTTSQSATPEKPDWKASRPRLAPLPPATPRRLSEPRPLPGENAATGPGRREVAAGVGAAGQPVVRDGGVEDHG